MKALTKSQWRAMWANIAGPLLGILGLIVTHESTIETQFPAAAWIPIIFPIVTTFYNSWQRSLTSKRSGTNTGIEASGDDPLAAAQAGKSEIRTLIDPYTPEEAEVVQTALALLGAQKAAAAARTKEALGTAYGLSAALIAAGHAAIDETKAAEASDAADLPIAPGNPDGSEAPDLAPPVTGGPEPLPTEATDTPEVDPHA